MRLEEFYYFINQFPNKHNFLFCSALSNLALKTSRDLQVHISLHQMALTRRSELPRFVTLTVPMCSRPHSNKVHASKRHSVCLPSLNILLPMTQPLQRLPHNPYTKHSQIRFVLLFCFIPTMYAAFGTTTAIQTLCQKTKDLGRADWQTRWAKQS